MNATLAAKFTGTPDQSAWTQIYEFTHELGEEGKLFLLVCLHFSSTITEIERLRRARAFVSAIHSAYEVERPNGILEALKNAINKALGELPSDQSFEIAAVSVVENAFYIAAIGTSVALFREGVIIPLLKSTQELESGSGFYKQTDQIICMTGSTAQKLSLGTLKGFLETGGASTFEEQVARFIHQQQTTSAFGIALVKVGEDREQRVAQVNEEPTSSPISIPSLPHMSIPVKKQMVGFIDRLLSYLPDRSLKVEIDSFPAPNKRRRLISILGVALIVVLAISIAVGIRNDRVKSSKEALSNQLAQITHDFSEAKSLANLNPGRARELAVSARNRVRELKESGAKDKDLDAVSKTIEEEIGSITGIYESSPEVYLDLALISSGFKGGDISASGERMTVLDKEARKAVEINIPTKKTQVIAGPDYLQDALAISAYANRSFILSSDGIREVGDEIELVIKPEDWDANNILMNAFAGNIYVVDRESNLLYRYPGAGGSFGAKVEWLAPGITAEFSDASAFKIDGSLWVMTREGRILRYMQGIPQNFTLPSQFSLLTAVDFFTDEEATYLYILDPQNARIVVLNKDGEYKAEYVSDQLKDGVKLIVSEANKKIIFLSQDKLWSLEIRHME